MLLKVETDDNKVKIIQYNNKERQNSRRWMFVTEIYENEIIDE